ncbi:Helix-turn-helix domain protein [candidate division SR1 bacterium Aalborg_AAW-1]|nr:Helix-turn-helix domain protein [candidate division SR1 bacterium Aalborg_AAW-1]
MIQHNTHQITKIMKALSNPYRLEIYLDLRNTKDGKIFDAQHGSCAIYSLCEKFQIGTSTISHHLKELEQANLIILKKNGKQLFATINPDTLQLVKNLFG